MACLESLSIQQAHIPRKYFQMRVQSLHGGLTSCHFFIDLAFIKITQYKVLTKTHYAALALIVASRPCTPILYCIFFQLCLLVSSLKVKEWDECFSPCQTSDVCQDHNIFYVLYLAFTVLFLFFCSRMFIFFNSLHSFGSSHKSGCVSLSSSLDSAISYHCT